MINPGKESKWIKKSLWKLLVIIAIPILISVFPAPEGLTKLAWVLSGIYLAAIVGLVIKPLFRTGCLVNRRRCLYGGDR
ncbi:anion permease [Klebsiella variicola subsp. variicola]|nr:anion permease [Klebsiella variicola subsp. variicola]